MGEPLPWNEPVPQAVAGLREILERARRGDATVLPELREALRSRPDLVQYCGDLASIAERAWGDLVAGQNLVLGESVKLRLTRLKASLGNAGSPTPRPPAPATSRRGWPSFPSGSRTLPRSGTWPPWHPWR